MRDTFRSRLKSHEPLIGTILTLPCTAIAEIGVSAGLDWLFLDMEHGQLEYSDVARMIQAIGDAAAVVVRLPEAREVWAKRILDLGATGLIFPQVKTAAQAQEICSWCRYAPAGTRSIGIARAQGYGAKLSEYLASANDSIAVVLQIEHAAAIADIEQILAVPGIDALFLGPYDLSASYGIPGQVDHPLVRDAMNRFLSSCRRANMPRGIFVSDNAAARRSLAEGYSLLAVGMDASLLRGSIMTAIDGLKAR
jgi:2-dehydro-3-deoxyglucarate aldolase